MLFELRVIRQISKCTSIICMQQFEALVKMSASKSMHHTYNMFVVSKRSFAKPMNHTYDIKTSFLQT